MLSLRWRRYDRGTYALAFACSLAPRCVAFAFSEGYDTAASEDPFSSSSERSFVRACVCACRRSRPKRNSEEEKYKRRV